MYMYMYMCICVCMYVYIYIYIHEDLWEWEADGLAEKYAAKTALGRGDDTFGNPHRDQIYKFVALRGDSISVNSILPPS